MCKCDNVIECEFAGDKFTNNDCPEVRPPTLCNLITIVAHSATHILNEIRNSVVKNSAFRSVVV